MQLRDLGEYRLKDLDRPQRLFQLNVDALESEFPPLKSLDEAGALMTLLMVDIAGWYALIRAHGDEWAAATARKFHGLAVAEIRRGGGRELEVVADTVLATFERPLDAVHAAKGLRDALLNKPWFPGDEPAAVSIGIHSGRVADPGGRHLGTTAYRCERLCHSAEPGQILVSHATEALLEGEVSEVKLRDLGERMLNGSDRPAHVFEVA